MISPAQSSGSGLSQKEEEILGGLRNAVNRGETLDMARISFMNAGYSPQIVEMAVRRLLSENNGAAPSPQSTSSNVSVPSSNLNLHAAQGNATPVSEVSQATSSTSRFSRGPPYWVIILMILISFLIIVGAGVIGLYWNRLFG
jgi:cobalamin biosynthesis Mg chelatase CobN